MCCFIICKDNKTNSVFLVSVAFQRAASSGPTQGLEAKDVMCSHMSRSLHDFSAKVNAFRSAASADDSNRCCELLPLIINVCSTM